MTLDPDVAVRLKEVREERKMSLHDTANVALRQGLANLSAGSKVKREKFSTQVFHVDEILVDPNWTCVSDLLDLDDQESYK